MKSVILAAVLAAAAASAPAFAQTPPASTPAPAPAAGQSAAPADAAAQARAEVGKTCAADFKAQCPNTAAGTPEQKQCVTEHFSDLSEGCRNAIMAMMAAQNGG